MGGREEEELVTGEETRILTEKYPQREGRDLRTAQEVGEEQQRRERRDRRRSRYSDGEDQH
jgi:hypothetical protein